jgi:hypothetical protein
MYTAMMPIVTVPCASNFTTSDQVLTLPQEDNSSVKKKLGQLKYSIPVEVYNNMWMQWVESES